MGTYAVTGAASGMGLAAADKLREMGHTVIGVDLRDADVIADLSTPEGRRSAADRVFAAAKGRLDGAVLAAGIGPLPGRDRPRLIFEVNFLGVVELLEDWRPALAATGNAKVVVVSSNSTTTTPLVPGRAVRALLRRDVAKAARIMRFRPAAPAMAYAASKIAVSRWVRREAVTPKWAGAGIRLNALAPGAIMTPLLQQQLDTPGQGKVVNSFPVPIGGFGNPKHLADWMVFMLSDSADFLCGSVVFVDGGSDACLRADSWPARVGPRALPRYVAGFAKFRFRKT